MSTATKPWDKLRKPATQPLIQSGSWETERSSAMIHVRVGRDIARVSIRSGYPDFTPEESQFFHPHDLRQAAEFFNILAAQIEAADRDPADDDEDDEDDCF